MSRSKYAARGNRVTRLPAPLVAAYAAGRLLNQLEWHLQQAWLLPAIDMGQAMHHNRAVSSILGDLAPTLQSALSAEAELRLRERLLTQRDVWHRLFHWPGHLTRIKDVADLILDEMAKEPEVPFQLFLEEWWRHEVDRVEAFASEVTQLIFAELKEPGLRALELGRWVDRGVHPRGAFRCMCRPTNPSVEEPPLEQLDPFSLEGGCINTESIAEEIRPVLYPITAGMIRPDPDWMEQLRHCWREMGLAVPDLENFVEQQRAASASGILTGIDRHIASLDKWVRDELADITPQEAVPPDERTRPMSLQEAARLMGLGGNKKGAERLRTYIDDGSIPCERLSRQRYIFSKVKFPKEVWDRLK
jgi:hypothetical protein